MSSRVDLPPGAEPPYRVFVGGVVQEEGSDYEVRGGTIHFTRSLAREGKLGFWRWLSMFLGLVGTYRPHEEVDVQYHSGGREQAASALEVHESAPSHGG